MIIPLGSSMNGTNSENKMKFLKLSDTFPLELCYLYVKHPIFALILIYRFISIFSLRCRPIGRTKQIWFKISTKKNFKKLNSGFNGSCSFLQFIITDKFINTILYSLFISNTHERGPKSNLIFFFFFLPFFIFYLFPLVSLLSPQFTPRFHTPTHIHHSIQIQQLYILIPPPQNKNVPKTSSSSLCR